MLRRLSAGFLVAHGVAHVVGCLGSWRLGDFADAPYTASILNGTIDVGDGVIRLVGLLWLAAAAGFAAAAIATWRQSPSAAGVTLVAATFSLLMSVVGLPDAVIGVAINVGILAALGALTLGRPGATRVAAP